MKFLDSSTLKNL